MRKLPSRQALVVLGMSLVAVVLVWAVVDGSRCRIVEAGFWFEQPTYDAGSSDASFTREEVDRIATVARSEIARAFKELNIAFSDHRDAAFRVRVVQELLDSRYRSPNSVPAESRAMTGLGGIGAVNFSWLASGALTYVPRDAGRPALLEAIGRGIGRSAVHEFAHMLLPRAPIHDSIDLHSYEYRSAGRREHFFGALHWDLAGPLLKQRLAHCAG